MLMMARRAAAAAAWRCCAAMRVCEAAAVPKTVGFGTGFLPLGTVVFPDDLLSRKYVPIMTVRKSRAVIVMVQ